MLERICPKQLINFRNIFRLIKNQKHEKECIGILYQKRLEVVGAVRIQEGYLNKYIIVLMNIEIVWINMLNMFNDIIIC